MFYFVTVAIAFFSWAIPIYQGIFGSKNKSSLLLVGFFLQVQLSVLLCQLIFKQLSPDLLFKINLFLSLMNLLIFCIFFMGKSRIQKKGFPFSALILMLFPLILLILPRFYRFALSSSTFYFFADSVSGNQLAPDFYRYFPEGLFSVFLGIFFPIPETLLIAKIFMLLLVLIVLSSLIKAFTKTTPFYLWLLIPAFWFSSLLPSISLHSNEDEVAAFAGEYLNQHYSNETIALYGLSITPTLWGKTLTNRILSGDTNLQEASFLLYQGDAFETSSLAHDFTFEVGLKPNLTLYRRLLNRERVLLPFSSPFEKITLLSKNHDTTLLIDDKQLICDKNLLYLADLSQDPISWMGFSKEDGDSFLEAVNNLSPLAPALLLMAAEESFSVSDSFLIAFSMLGMNDIHKIFEQEVFFAIGTTGNRLTIPKVYRKVNSDFSLHFQLLK